MSTSIYVKAEIVIFYAFPEKVYSLQPLICGFKTSRLLYSNLHFELQNLLPKIIDWA